MTIKNDQSKAFFNQASDANCQQAKEKYSFFKKYVTSQGFYNRIKPLFCPIESI